MSATVCGTMSMVLEEVTAATAVKVTRMTSTVPVGESRLVPWNAATAVEPVANDSGFASGASLNSDVVPPPTASMMMTAGS